MDSKEPSGTKKMKEKFDDREMTTDQLEDVAGGTKWQMMMDSKFLNYMLGDKVCRRWNGEEVDWEDNYPYVYIRDAWAKVGVKAGMSDHMDVPNTYSIDGRQVTRSEAFLHAQKVLNKFVTDSDWM